MMRARKGLLVGAVTAAAGLAGVAPAAAASSPSGTTSTPAGTTTTPTGTTTTPTTPTPAPAPVKAAGALLLSGAFRLSGGAVTVPGRPFDVRGIVRPYVFGQVVELRVYLNGRLLAAHQLALKPSGRAGAFTALLRSPAAGRLELVLTHQRNQQMLGFEWHRALRVLVPRAGPGSRGPFVALIQQRLEALHFYLRRSGVYDSFTALAIDAYHRLLGWGTSSALSGRTISFLLDGWGQFHVRYTGQGPHAEGDLTHQLLALVDHNRVRWIFPISSGKPSTPTVLGSWRIYIRDPGYLPDGMYYSSFFYRGYAIHGYDPAPDYPASHGCMRLPIQDAIFVYDWLAMGDWVDTYYR
jgi:hypothetical protein